MNHTPGPWEVVHRDDNNYMSMTLVAQKGVFDTPDNVRQLRDEPDHVQERVIAITFHQSLPIVGDHAIDCNQERGNAKLIALAPEMADAIRAFGQTSRNGDRQARMIAAIVINTLAMKLEE